ncbi:S-adenosyl-methyltransferase mraW [Plasmodium malariae]|uniref:S-adenosyl-methyltransferase mraW n=1 Tax=Plasmodium malariae TaxID=5858 RepID=A0A1A8WIX9_PLAMA|nr:S-adenosyl-methyltransferase mraW [Plasmodium malariae]
MFHFLIIFLFLLNNDLIICFKIKNWKSQYVPRYSANTNNSPFEKGETNRYSFSFSLKNKEVHEQNESNIFDKSYVYHTPVLLEEVIRHIRYRDTYDQTGEDVSGGGSAHNDADIGVDVGTDVGVDVGTDVGVDVGTDIGISGGNSGNCTKLTPTVSSNNRWMTLNKHNERRPPIDSENEKAKKTNSSNFPYKEGANIFYLNDVRSIKEESNTNGEKEVGYYIDSTLGGGGHTLEILKNITECKVIGIDKDIESIYYNKVKLQNYLRQNRLTLIQGDYRNIIHLLSYHSLPLFNSYNGMIVDLGLSSHQLTCSKRGFSYKYNGILDMNMNKYTEREYIRRGMSKDKAIDHVSKNSVSDDSSKNYAFDDTPKSNSSKCINKHDRNMMNKIHVILNTYSFKKLKFIIETYGQEKKASKIARKIILWRKNNEKMITTTYELKEIILSTCKKNYKSNNKVLSRVFQSFRIYINDELKALKELLISAHKLLKHRSRLILISYHSLEYKCIQNYAENRKNWWKKINENPITPNEREIRLNNSSRSAKMTVFEKI